MRGSGRKDFDLAHLAVLAASGDASEEQLRELHHGLLEDREAAELVVDILSQDSWLSWNSSMARKGSVRQDLAERIHQIVGSSDVDHQLTHSPSGSASPVLLTVAASLLLCLGGLLGWNAHLASLGSQSRQASIAEENTPDAYEARLVRSTACVWTPDSYKSIHSLKNLRTGESLRLLQGLAKLQLQQDRKTIDLTIEGPAGLTLTAEHGASLSHGSFTIDTDLEQVESSLETPIGTLKLLGKSSVGMAVSGSGVEIHSFGGSARFVVPWTSQSLSDKTIKITEGTSLTLLMNSYGELQTTHGTADPEKFAAKISMGSDSLYVPPRYVEDVIEGKPILYWRFEGNEDGLIRNEVDDRFHGRISGSPKLAGDARNHYCSLGSGINHEEVDAYIVAEDTFESEFDSGYTVELWAKPSHYHWGSLVALLGEPPHPNWSWTQGLLLECGGVHAQNSTLGKTGGIRYLHRSPPSTEISDGTSIFSRVLYKLRKWQHIVAVKNQNEMFLYIDGKLLASGEDHSELAKGMKLIVGQLDERQFHRGFVGQLDELAFYPRALTEEEINRHFHSIRSQNHPASKRVERTF